MGQRTQQRVPVAMETGARATFASVSRRRFLLAIANVAAVSGVASLVACQSSPAAAPTAAPAATSAPSPTAASATSPTPAAAATTASQPTVAPAAATPVPSPTVAPATAAAVTPGKPMYQVDPVHSGRSPHAGPTHGVASRTFDMAHLPVPTLHPASPRMDIQSTSAVGPDGTIYIGANNSNFYAVTPDGALKWLYEAEREYSGIWATAALSADASALFFGANKGGIYALNATDGKLRWQFPIYGSVYSSPALDTR